jgi:hypothetical protein
MSPCRHYAGLLLVAVTGCTTYERLPPTIEAHSSPAMAASNTVKAENPTTPRAAASTTTHTPTTTPTPPATHTPATRSSSSSACNPATFRGEPLPACEGAEPEAPAVGTLPDLNGDGQPEVALRYASSATSQGLTILTPTGTAACYRAVYEGPAGALKVIPAKGWQELELNAFHRGVGSAKVRLRYTGVRFEASKVVACEDYQGKPFGGPRCDEQAAGMGLPVRKSSP